MHSSIFPSYFLPLLSMCGKSPVGMVAWILVMVGALNWGLVGLGAFMNMDLNIVHMILGSLPQIEWIVYILVGLSALYGIFNCKQCSK